MRKVVMANPAQGPGPLGITIDIFATGSTMN